jgi:hypothetical protein
MILNPGPRRPTDVPLFLFGAGGAFALYRILTGASGASVS